MAHLQKERTVAKSITSLDTFAAADTQRFVNSIFIVGLLNKSAFDSACGTKLIFRAAIESVRLRYKVASAEFAISAHGKVVNAFDRRHIKHTISGAVPACHTLVRVNLPNGVIRPAAAGNQTHYSTQTK
jgi:hypothetical protein